MATSVKNHLQTLRDQLAAKQVLNEDISQKISGINLQIYVMSQKFFSEAAKIQNHITKVQLSRPRGNPAYQWPHCAITPRIRNFYRNKELKERELWSKRDQLKQTYDHEKAILTTQRRVLEDEQFDAESQIRILLIQIK